MLGAKTTQYGTRNPARVPVGDACSHAGIM
jgi:hypothetical protein